MTARSPSDQDSAHVRLILAIRRQRGYTQLDLAHHLGVSLSTIANWESGRTDPHPMWVQLLRQLILKNSG